MNTPALVSRLDQKALPQWNPGSPGYMALQNGNGEDSRQSARMLTTLRKYWWLAALIWAAVAIPLCIYIVNEMPPEYPATGTINIAPVIVNPVNSQAEVTPFYNEYLRTQAELIKNPYVLQRAAEDIRLTKYTWFRDLTDQVGYLTKNITVIPVSSTQNIQVFMAHKDPEAAKAIVDSVIDAYFRTHNELEEQSVDKNLQILKDLQAHTDKALKDAQEKLAQLTTDGNMSWSTEDRAVIAEVLKSARTSQAQLITSQMALQNQLETVKAKPLPDETTYKASIPIDQDPQIQQWTSERNRVLMADNVLASAHATEKHPQRVEYRKQIKVLEDKIAARKQEIQDNAWSFYKAGIDLERSNNILKLQSDLEGTKIQLAALEKHINEQESMVRDLGNKERPIASLREQIGDDKDALKRYTDRIGEIENQNRAPGRVTSVAPTVLPRTPVDKRRNYLLAANGLGFMLAMAVMLMIMKFRDRIDHADDLPTTYQPLIVGTVSHTSSAARGLHGKMGRKILGEEMRLLHANLLPPGPVQRRIMMVTSPTPSNGKTSIASQLAMSLAKSGLEVLLIDGDLRKRDLSTMFDVGFRPGLADLLQGRPPELIRPVELLPNLRLMGAGTKLERNPVELLQRKHFHESLNLLQEKFDCIIVDTPPTLVVADARLIARSCDEVLCVVRAQVSSPRDVNQTIDALSRITGKTPKIIVNGVAHKQSYYKYKFAYSSSENDAADVQARGVDADTLD